ncbi:MAG: type II toxin-antitoxin system RelE/ParE family toxin [Oscillospiraceae bacterium]|nr:type II toxin-antitoxin system RelE/ParE family toxin [Oscillospiraceae bacterium]
MKREFIRTHIFEEDWKDAGLDDNNLNDLEEILLRNPKAGVVIPHLSGGRKLRFAVGERGKSGGVRVIYIDIVVREHIYLLLAYPKNVKADLTSKQKDLLNKLIAEIKGG